jgi:hypothetical protein
MPDRNRSQDDVSISIDGLSEPSITALDELSCPRKTTPLELEFVNLSQSSQIVFVRVVIEEQESGIENCWLRVNFDWQGLLAS